MIVSEGAEVRTNMRFNLLTTTFTAIVLPGLHAVTGVEIPDSVKAASGVQWFVIQQIRDGCGSATEEQDPDSPAIPRAVVLHNLAVEQQKRGRREEAIVLLRDAVSLLETARNPNPDEVLPSLNLLAALYLETGQTAQARALLKRAVALGKRSENKRNHAQTLIVLAELERATGNYDDARRAASNALKLTDPAFPDYPSFFEGVQNQLARIAFETSNHRSAAAHWKLALASLSARRSDRDEQVLSLRVDIARISVHERRLQEAETELLAVTRLAEASGHQVALARGLYVLGTLYVEQKQSGKAEAHYSRSLAITDKDLGEKSADSALCLLELAKLHLKEHRPGAALNFSSRSTTILVNGNSVPLVWLDVLQIHGEVLKKLSRKEESKQVAELVSKLFALKRFGNQTIDIKDLPSRK
jgi:tetratricopeptide (TPR) repeat protein